MQQIHLPEVKSTNTWLLDAIGRGEAPFLTDDALVWTMRQTAGRGQIGNSWEAEPDKNISFSLLLHPTFLHPRDQFVISQITALAIAEEVDGLIKWPNDIFVNEGKICGILIENKLQGATLAHTVIGVGINVNQERWVSNAPNPTSIKLQTGIEQAPCEVMQRVVGRIMDLYQQLQTDPLGVRASVHEAFCQRLYRRAGFYPYVDAKTGVPFEAAIEGVEPTGQLRLRTRQGEVREYWFKEVKFVLPCGVTKE